MTSPAGLELHRHRLANGLRVVVQHDSSLPLVALNLWYHVGSKNERPGRTGFAHLFEHMLFQGSENVGTNDHFRHVQQAGGVANGSTWFDRTNYYETLPSGQLELALWLESDRMGHLLPALDQEKLDRQREVVLNERRQTVDNQPYGRAGERLYELLFPEPHPYHWPVLGYPDDLAQADLDDVVDFFRTFYTPANAVLSLVGDCPPDVALAAVERYFGGLPATPPPPPVAAPPPAVRAVRETLEDRVELPRVYLAWVTPAFGEPSWYAADLLASVLADGKSSPLYRSLVYERQLAQDVGAYVQPSELCATFLVVATARPEVPIDRLEQATLELVAAAADAAPGRELFERALNRTVTLYREQLQRFDLRADLLSQFTTLFDRPERLGDEMDRYRALSPQQLRDFAAGHLGAEQRVSLCVVPGGDHR